MKRITLSLALALAGLMATSAIAAELVKPDNSNFQYTGRIDFATPAAPVITWPGTSIAANFTSSSLSVRLDDQLGKNYFNVFIDGDELRPLVIKADQGMHTYVVASGLAAGRHSLLLTKRTEGEEGATVFAGVELADGGHLLAPPQRPKRRIEFYGDSITSGAGNEAPESGRDDLLNQKNNYQTYAAITARKLQAEMHVISQSGIGVMISWFPFTMPQFYDQLSAVGDNDSTWDFTRWTPDVVVINLLQNDSWLIGGQHRLQPEPDDTQRIAAYKSFVKRIRQLYPSAFIVCTLGSMDATKPGSPWPAYVTTAVEQIRHENQDKRIDTLFFEFTGYGQHPRVKHHQANAAKLTAFIKEKMGW